MQHEINTILFTQNQSVKWAFCLIFAFETCMNFQKNDKRFNCYSKLVITTVRHDIELSKKVFQQNKMKLK